MVSDKRLQAVVGGGGHFGPCGPRVLQELISCRPGWASSSPASALVAAGAAGQPGGQEVQGEVRTQGKNHAGSLQPSQPAALLGLGRGQRVC